MRKNAKLACGVRVAVINKMQSVSAMNGMRHVGHVSARGTAGRVLPGWYRWADKMN